MVLIMPPIFTICSECERHALRRPKRGRAMAEALACLTQLLLSKKRLRGLTIAREQCLQNCPLGKICVALSCCGCTIRHHLDPGDDLEQVAANLVGTHQPRLARSGPDSGP